jgi:hypothetical protein
LYYNLKTNIMTEGTTQYSPEEMAARQTEIQAYYESQIPFLEVQKQYETLITELQELEARRAMATMRLAQIMAPIQESEAKAEGKPEERKLRKEK